MATKRVYRKRHRNESRQRGAEVWGDRNHDKQGSICEKCCWAGRQAAYNVESSVFLTSYFVVIQFPQWNLIGHINHI